MKATLFTIFYLLLLLSPMFSQTPDEKELQEYFSEGRYFYNRKDYTEALFFYRKLLEHQPDNAHYNFISGECLLNIPGRGAEAVPYLEKAIKNVVSKRDFNPRSFLEVKAPLHAWFYLGNAYQTANQLEKALEAYQFFITSPHYLGNYNEAIVENEIKACERAKIIRDSPIRVTFTPLPPHINTSASELYPVVSATGNHLVFIRRLAFYDALYFAVNDENGWGNPVIITPEIGSDGEYHPSALSADGKELYLIRSLAGGKKELHTSRYENGQWTKAEKVFKRSLLFNIHHASVTDDGARLFISADRRGGKGGIDLYSVTKNRSGEWHKLKSLGKVINTPFDETTPFTIYNGRVLFFSSKGHYGMGGFDIFYSTKTGNRWSSPRNIGYPINSTGDNLFFVPLPTGKGGYMSRFPEEGGKEDIYMIEIDDVPNFE